MLERDHPDIERAMRTGFASKEIAPIFCPVCGEELAYDDTLIVREDDGEVLGCHACTKRRNALLVMEEARC